ncbi:MAG: hypothetical protein KGJ80_01975 [Chloroflexota bacterium]|nr:hypothetical protein [Chloroflexota bacterium]
MSRTILALLLVAGMMASVAVAGSAQFTSTAGVAASTFITGTVVITTDHSSTALFNVTGMAPGDQLASTLVVTSTGTLPLRYAMTSAVTDTVGLGLKSALLLGIKASVSPSCSPTNYLNSVNAEIYTGTLASAAFGNPNQGFQSGDRSLSANGGNEALCFFVTLPLTATNSVQGATSTATFTFDAEQTTNN